MKKTRFIPLAKPLLDRREGDAVKRVLSTGWITQGPKAREFEEAFAAYVGARYACSISNCTAALHLALLSLGVGPGDVVITASHSFIATANSIRHCGAEPVFADIDLETYNMSPESLRGVLDGECKVKKGGLFYKGLSRVAAIMPVHQMGMPCDLRSILAISKRYAIPVVEDAACAMGSEIKSGRDGKWRRIGKPHAETACFSFHPRKLVTTGEGGMITTNDKELYEKIRLLKQHGMSISDRARHESKKVLFEEYLITGYNYRMSDINAAVGLEQLKKLPRMLRERRQIEKLYAEKLGSVRWLKLPAEPPYCRSNWQSYPVRVLKGAPVKRDVLMRILLNKGIATHRGIMNAHQEKAYAPAGIRLANSETARDSVVLLPLFCGMKRSEVERVACEIRNI